MQNGFAVASYGRTVNVLWADACKPGASSCQSSMHPYVLMAGGVISDVAGQQPYITWYVPASGYCGGSVSLCAILMVDVTTVSFLDINYGVSATYSASGQLAFAYDGSTGSTATLQPVLDRVNCADVFCNPNAPGATRNELGLCTALGSCANFYAQGTILLESFQSGTGAVAAIYKTVIPNSIEAFVEWQSGSNTDFSYCAGSSVFNATLPGDFDPNSQIAAAATGGSMEIFVAGTVGGSSSIQAYFLQQQIIPGPYYGPPACVISEDPSVEAGYGALLTTEPYYISASTEWDGDTIDLFFAQGTSPAPRYLTHATVFPQQKMRLDLPGTTALPWANSYPAPQDITVEAVSSHYVIGEFDLPNTPSGGYTTTQAFEFPVQSDYNVGPNDPWVQLPGAMAVQEQGGGVNPASGVLSYRLPLFSTPLQGGAESLSLDYVEPGLYSGSASVPVVSRDASPYDFGMKAYGYGLQSSMFLDLPWIDVGRNVLHLGALNAFDMIWNITGLRDRWFNNTAGVRFNLHYIGATGNYNLFLSGGLAYVFAQVENNGQGVFEDVTTAYLDATGATTLTFMYDGHEGINGATGRLWTIVPSGPGPSVSIGYDPSSAYQINAISYEGGKQITFCRSGCSLGSSALQVISPSGQAVAFQVDLYSRLTGVIYSAGGNLSYSYTANGLWGTSTSGPSSTNSLFSFPVTRELIYNATSTAQLTRQLQLNYHFQGDANIETDLNVSDAFGVREGATEYRFRSVQELTSVRSLDASGQVLYYDMQSLSGGAISDLSGNGNNAVVSGSPSVVGGRYGTTYSLNPGGTWQYASASNAASLNPSSVTVTAWVNYRGLVSDTSSATIVRKYDVNPNYGYILDVLDPSSSCPRCLRFYIGGTGGNGGAYNSAAILPSANVWYFVAGTYQNGTHAISIYINGSQVYSVVKPSSFALSPSTQPLGVGLNLQNVGHPASPFNGMIDEVRVFSRTLSSDEIQSLYQDNAIQTKLTQTWWSGLGRPQVTDTFNGFGTPNAAFAPSATSSYAVDDWGNLISTRDASGNESFASFANTNNQYQFYRPARLEKSGNGLLYSNNFDYGINDFNLATETGDASTSMDWGYYGRYAPSMKISMSAAASDLRLTRSITSTSSPTVEFHVRAGDAQTSGVLQFGFSVASATWYLKFTGGAITLTTSVGGTIPCGSYSANTWYTVGMQEFPSTGMIYVDLNRAQTCSQTTGGLAATAFSIEATNPGGGSHSVWIDDLRVVTGLAVININGLQTGQIVDTVGPDGTILSSVEQTSGTLQIADPASPLGSWNNPTAGDLSILVYGTDGTLEYASPRTDFSAGDTYTFVPSQTFESRFVKTRSGFDYYDQTILNAPIDMGGQTGTCWDSGGIACGWSSTGTGWDGAHYFLPVSPSQGWAHPLGYTADVDDEWVTGLNKGPVDTSKYLVTYAYIPSANLALSREPLGIGLGIQTSASSAFRKAQWGMDYTPGASAGRPAGGISSTYKGVLPMTTGTTSVLKFVIWEGDPFFQLLSGNTITGLYYQVDGGQAYFAGTSIGASDSDSVTILDANGLTVSINRAYDDTPIVSSACLATCTISLYPMVSVFPISVKLKVTDVSGNVLYYSAPVTVWGGDVLNYMPGQLAASLFYDQGSSPIIPSTTIHSGEVGQLTPQADCPNALACYDMEAISSSTDRMTYAGTAVLSGQVVDLSGRHNDATLANANYIRSAPVSSSASGLGLIFDGSQARMPFTAAGVNTAPWTYVTVSFWMDWTGTTGQMPFGFHSYALWFSSGYFGFTTGNGDIQGTSSAGLSNNLVHVAAVFRNQQVLGDSLYINGVQQTLVNQGNIYNNNAAFATTDAQIGGWSNASGGRLFGGVIDQFAIYNGQLTSQQITGLYRSRLPNAAGTFYHPDQNGFPDRARTTLNGQFVETVLARDGYGNVVASSLNGNQTTYEYSAWYGGAHLTGATRPDGAATSYSYDAYSGSLESTLDPNCRLSRYAYDSSNRPTQAAAYDSDSATVLWLDMSSASVINGQGDSTLRDVSCHFGSAAISGLGSNSFVRGPTPLSGMAGGFTGGGSFTQVADSGLIDFSGSNGHLTLSAWVNVATSGQETDFIQKANPEQGLLQYALLEDSGNHLDFAIVHGGATASAATTMTLTRNVWYFVAVTYDSTNGVTFYVNGTSVPGSTFTGTIDSVATPLYVPGVTFGHGGYAETLVGSMDEARIQNRVLSASEISAMYLGTYKMLSSGSTAYDDSTFPSVTTYDATAVPRSLYFDMSTMKVGQSNSVEDLSGSGNNGIETGTANVAGKVGNARSFNGTSDHISVSRFIAPAKAFTFAAWLNPSVVSTTTHAIFQIGSWNSAGTTGAWIGDASGANIIFGRSSPDTQIRSNVAPTAGVWVHVAFVWDGSTMSMYVNGVKQSQTATFTAQLSGATLDLGALALPLNYFYSGAMDEVQVLPIALTATQVSNLYSGYTPGSASFDPTHLSRTYFDGLGRPVRETAMDLYGHRLTTAQSMGWDDQPTLSFLTTGQYATYLYSFMGMAEQTVAPKGLSSMMQMALYSQREVQTVDGDGHVGYALADALGRTVQSGVLNPSGSTFNYTLTAYNALGQPTAVDVYSGAAMVQGTTSYYYNTAGLLVYEVYPDGTSQSRTYDGDLRLSTVTDPMGRVATYTYVSTSGQPGFKMGWVANVAFKNSASATTCYAVVYTYDVTGDITRIANGTAQSCGSSTLSSTTATVNRYYDSLYRLWNESVLVGSTNLTTNESLDAAGRVTSIRYPQGQGVANYVYDPLGRVRQVNFNNSEYASVQYDAYGRLLKTWYFQAGTNTSEFENYSYDAMNRITAVSVLGTTNLMQLVYRYDAASLVTSISDNLYPGGTSSVKTDTFRYDGNGRLIYTNGPFSTKALLSNDDRTGFLNYSYDALGNILKRQDSDLGTCTSNCLWTSSQTVTYTYTGPYDQLTATTGAKAESFTYNGLGSMTSRSNFAYAFDFQQQLMQTKSTTPAYTYTYSYDGTGRKVKEVDAMASTYTLYYGYLGPTLAYAFNTTGSKGTVFVYLGDTLLFRKDSSSATAHLYATDLSKNVRLVWSYASGVVVEGKFRYKPFGEPATPIATPSADPRFRYAEQAYSSPTKLYQMGARSYAADLGRFTSRDPVGGHGYAYARDDPIAFWDPSGFDAWSFLASVLVGAAVFAGVAFACAATAGVGCLVAGAILAAGAGALADVGITSARGGQVTWGTVGEGALGGLLGAGAAFGAMFPEAAMAGLSSVASGVSEGLGTIGGVIGLGAAEDVANDLDAEPPTVPVSIAQTGDADSMGAIARDEGVILREEPTFKSPQEAMVARDYLYPTSNDVEYEPLGGPQDVHPNVGVGPRVPDFLVGDGPYRGYVEVGGKVELNGARAGQLEGLAWLHDVTGLPVHFFYQSASEDFITYARELGVQLHEF